MNESKKRITDLSPARRDLLLRRLAKTDHHREQQQPDLIRREYDKESGPPLSFAQERQWFLDELTPGNPAYNITGALRLKGRLSVRALTVTLDQIYGRHETLRSNFHAVEGKTAQIIHPPATLPLDVVDLSDLAPDIRESERCRLYVEETVRGFDLRRDRLFRAKLLRLEEDDHLLILTMHHITGDGWSIGVIMDEIAAFYTGVVESRDSTLPTPAVRYSDFAAWQRDRLSSGALDSGLRYWGKQLENPPPVLQLPPDQNSDPGASSGERMRAGAVAFLRIQSELKEALDHLSRKEGTTLFVTMLCAFFTLLMRCTGQEDIVIGSPVSGRDRIETEGIVGLFVNTIALRAVLSRHLTFRDALALVRAIVLDGLAHHEVPFERVVQDLDPERKSNMHPLFETVFNFTPDQKRHLDLPGLRVTFEESPELVADFSMQLYVAEWQGSIELKLVYPHNDYSASLMACFLKQFQAILQQVAADPSRTLGFLDLVTEQSLAILSDAKASIEEPAHLPVVDCIAGWAESTPQAVAIEQGEIRLNYAELGARLSAIADHLGTRGLTPGTPVAVYGRRSPGVVVSMAGVLASGGVLLTLSPDLPHERRRIMLEEAGTRVLLCAGDAGSRDPWLQELHDIEIIWIRPDGTLCSDSENSGNHPRAKELERAQPAYIFFTSGSTGKPKGVLGTHAGLAHFLNWQRQTFDVGPGDRCGQLTGLSFDVVLRDVFLGLTSGATLVLPSDEDTSSPENTLRWFDREHISLIHVVPALAETWLLSPPQDVTLASLRRIFFAGEPLGSILVGNWRRAFPQSGEIINLYGPTETTLAKCFYRVPARPRKGIQPLGMPMPQTQALVLTPERNLCGVGEQGEIALRTPFRSLGYVNAPDENAKRFILNPFTRNSSDVLYLTGDRGYYETSGLLRFVGRTDDQIKIRGVRVEPTEVASTLQFCPEVQSCAVVAREDGPELLLVAYVVLKKGAQQNPARMLEYLRHRLPAAMVPGAIVFLDQLPLTANQKLDREKLPAPAGARPKLEGRYVAPRDAAELAIAQIVEDLLGLRPVGVTDSFFELGGHSLMALRLLMKIEQKLGQKIPLAALFESPTVEHLAAVVRQRENESLLAVPLWSADCHVKLFLVHPGGGTLLNYVHLVRHLAAPTPVYGLQARGLDGKSQPHKDLTQMAADYIKEVRRIQPEGPYLLAGHSLGGVIAFEMARQLDQTGCDVELLALLDSVMVASADSEILAGNEPYEDARRLTDMLATIERFIGRNIGVAFEKLCAMNSDEQVEYVVAALRASDALPMGEGVEMTRNLLNVSKAHLQASRSYRAGRSKVPITLLRARETRRSDFPLVAEDALMKDDLGWGAASATPVRIVWVPGDHVTMMAEPHVRKVADALRSMVCEAIGQANVATV